MREFEESTLSDSENHAVGSLCVTLHDLNNATKELQDESFTLAQAKLKDITLSYRESEVRDSYLQHLKPGGCRFDSVRSEIGREVESGRVKQSKPPPQTNLTFAQSA